ncbi:SAC3/GANP/Nin1/mts3/eIF-3 p25 family-domain-containing protein [Sparassis latifolia]
MMDASSHPRTRGLRINGASGGSRSQSKNRKWVAGEPSGSGSHSSNGERWERGGHRKARGASRGNRPGRTPTPPSANTAIHEDAADITDDDRSGEDELDDEEHRTHEPQTLEERERFYQELVKARDSERNRAIAEGKMDDPTVSKRLDEAITIVGTCMDMCPRFERYRRERENNLDRWEVVPGTKRVDHKRAVKIYERGAGDKSIPSDIRPPPVLKTTLDYLFHDLLMRGGFAETHDFIRDRSRAVRNDFTLQHDKGPIAIECHDRCARFHILALHLERDNPRFSIALEEQQLMNTLQTLKECYEDQRGNYQAPTELEMRVYHRLIHIRDQRERHEEIPQEITSHPVFLYTTQFRLHVQAKSSPISKTSTLVVDAEAMQIFGQLVTVLREQNNVVMVYLVACILERLFGKDTIEDIEAIRGAMSIPDIIDGISQPLTGNDAEAEAYISDEDAVEPALPPPIDSAGGIFASAANTSRPQSVFGRASATTAAETPRPVVSAFGNLKTTPNAFGTASVFGGSVLSSSAPKSVFGSATFPTSSSPATSVSAPQLSSTVFGASSSAPANVSPSPTSGGFGKSAFPPASSSSTLKSSTSAPFSRLSGSLLTAPPPIARSSKIFGPPLFATGVASAPTAPTVPQPPETPHLNPFASSFTPSTSSLLFSNIPTTTPSIPPPTAPTPQAAPTFITPTPPAVSAFGIPSPPILPASTTSTPVVAAFGTTIPPTLPAFDATSSTQATPPFNAPPPNFFGSSSLPVLATSPSAPPTLPPPSSSTPSVPPESAPLSAGNNVPATPKIIERSQTLWEIPSSASPLRLPTGITTSTPGAAIPHAEPEPESPIAPPPVDTFRPISLPPTPTARWFDPSSQSKLTALSKKRSLLGFALQIPEGTSSTMLSPLPLPSPGVSKVYQELNGSPSQQRISPSSSFSSAQSLAKPASQTNFQVNGHVSAMVEDKEVLAHLTPLALHFLRKSRLVKRLFKVWKKRTTDTALWEEAVLRSEAYTAKVRRERLARGQSSPSTNGKEPNKRRRASGGGSPETSPFKRAKRRVSARFEERLTDDQLAQRLQENHEEHRRRWEKGSFLRTVRMRLKGASPRGLPSPEWRLWLTMNPENDRTAIWLEHKFDVPASGVWESENTFSIQGSTAVQDPPSHGSPGLIVFERTPLEGITDELERKIRILDDCARLREVIGNLPQSNGLRFVPSLLVIVWTEEERTKPEVTRDFEDMTAKLAEDGVIKCVSTFSISSTSTDLDRKFNEFVAAVPLDVKDKLSVSLSWKDVSQVFLASFRTMASDWLDSCWAHETFVWPRYQHVLRAMEESLNHIIRSIIRLFGLTADVSLKIPAELQVPPNIGTGYAMGPFLDAHARLAIATAAEVLGERRSSARVVPKALVEALRSEIERHLQAHDDHLRELSIASLPISSRTSPKRRATDDVTVDSPPPRSKRMRSSSYSGNVEDAQDGVTASLPPRTSRSTADIADRAEKPVITAAMLRALTQDVFKTYGRK